MQTNKRFFKFKDLPTTIYKIDYYDKFKVDPCFTAIKTSSLVNYRYEGYSFEQAIMKKLKIKDDGRHEGFRLCLDKYNYKETPFYVNEVIF